MRKILVGVAMLGAFAAHAADKVKGESGAFGPQVRTDFEQERLVFARFDDSDATQLRGRTRGNVTVVFTGDAAPGELVDVEIAAATSTTLRGAQRTAPTDGRSD